MAKFTDYTEKTEPVDTDLALIYDTPAKVNKKFTFGNLWKWIAKKIVSEGISQLDTTNKTIPGAINELNSKIISGVINQNQDNTIVFPKMSGCLLLLYHPYWNNGIYTFSPYPNSDVTSVQTVIKADIASITLKGLTLTISANECPYSYFAICCDFYN